MSKLILGIETSCDETAAAVIEAAGDGRLILRSSVVASQIELHRRFGGVVPEIASRAHTEAIVRITTEALGRAGTSVDGLSGIGVTYTPGLIGALLVGVNFAKALAYSNGVPLVGVNHIKAHAAATFIAADATKGAVQELGAAPLPTEESPALALIASGGHTSILLLRSPTDYRTLGRTRDDAMGEAFDKIGRVLGLPYPGGAALDRLAAEFLESGRTPSFTLPPVAIAGDTLDFSFSGLKTCVLDMINHQRMKGEEPDPAELAAALTITITSSVTRRLEEVLELTGARTLFAAGGATANSHLRRALAELAARRGVRLYLPPLSLCGDNGAMVAAQAYFELLEGNVAPPSLNGLATGESEL